MTKFVWLRALNGGEIPVNPEQVQYVKNTPLGPALVFGAVTGGFHELHIEGEPAEIIAHLEGRGCVCGAMGTLSQRGAWFCLDCAPDDLRAKAAVAGMPKGKAEGALDRLAELDRQQHKRCNTCGARAAVSVCRVYDRDQRFFCETCAPERARAQLAEMRAQRETAPAEAEAVEGRRRRRKG